MNNNENGKIAKEIIFNNNSTLDSLTILAMYGDKKYKAQLKIIEVEITNFNVL